MQRREREGILGRDTTGSMYASWDNHTHTPEKLNSPHRR